MLNPVSNEPKTVAGQLDNVKNLFGDTPILTSHKLSPIFAGRKLNVKSVEDIDGIEHPLSLKSTIGQIRYRSLMVDVLPVVIDYTPSQDHTFGEETANLTDEEFYQLLFTKFSPEFIENMDITVPKLQAFGRVEDCMSLKAAIYEPPESISTTDIFCADPMPHFGATPEVWKRDVLGEWKGYVQDGKVRFHHVGGNHINDKGAVDQGFPEDCE